MSTKGELERLTNEYDAVLVQYNKVKADQSGTKRQLVKGQLIIGGQALGETDAQSAEDCSAICASDEKCTGASFKSGKCTSYSGAELDATPSDNKEDYAIYNANMKLAKSLNTKLKDLGRTIRELSKGKPDSTETMNQLNTAEHELNIEEELLDIELQKRDDMASAVQETTIQTTMNQYWYWILIAGIILLIGTLIYIFLKTTGTTLPTGPSRYSNTSNSRPSSSSSWFPSSSRPSSSSSWFPSSSNSSSNSSSWSMPSNTNNFSRNRMFGGLKPGKLKYEALIPGVVMLLATLTATQLQKVIF